jgi:hypothetical protein
MTPESFTFLVDLGRDEIKKRHKLEKVCECCRKFELCKVVLLVQLVCFFKFSFCKFNIEGQQKCFRLIKITVLALT